MNYKSIYKTFLTALLAVGSASCNDFLEDYSQDLAKVESWKDLDEVLLGEGYLKSSNIYIANSMVHSDIQKNLDILHFMSDELAENLVPDDGDLVGYRSGYYYGFHTWQRDTGTDENGRHIGGDEYYWDMLYEKLNAVNQVCTVIEEQGTDTPDDVEGKTRVRGEAHFLRAAYYFLLANLYARPYVPSTAATENGVPLKTSEYVEDIEYTKASLQDVYNTILEDLRIAEENLSQTTRKSVYRADITAVNLLQSRVYLYMQNWDKAAEYAQKVIDRQPALLDYHALTPGTNVVSKSSPETIFTMGGYCISLVSCDHYSSWGNDYPSYIISDDMKALYGEDDLRSELYIGASKETGTYPCFIKVDGSRDSFGPYYDVSDCFLMRTAEAYLNLAEAEAYRGHDGAACTVLHTLLNHRMRTGSVVNKSGEELIQFIRDERAREFLLEGHRWFDLRRYTVNTVAPWSKEIVHTHTYWTQQDYQDIIIRREFYRLEKNDAAYTLPVPQDVVSFQNSIQQHTRPDRKCYTSDIPDTGDDDEDDWDDDDWDW